jgi:FkbM family methyltransferase
MSHVHEWLGLEREEVKLWVIVGGYKGDEVRHILASFPNSQVEIFEPSNRYHDELVRRFSTEPRVKIRRHALSNKSGKGQFFETSLEGSGSLLPLGKHSELFGSKAAETFSVEISTLDFFYEGCVIDVLQIDVQGAEALVISGAGKVLPKTRAVLIEIAMTEGLYRGGASWAELDTRLQKSGFFPVLVGTDTNLTGNALFVRPSQNNGTNV